MVCAAGCTFAAFGIATVANADALQSCGHTLVPVASLSGEDVLAPGPLHGDCRVQPAHQIDDAQLFAGELPQIGPDPLATIGVERAQERQAADGEAGVIQIRVALATGKSAVRLLLDKQELRVPITAVGVDLCCRRR